MTAGGKPDVILIGTGSEVSLCVEAHEKLTAEGVKSSRSILELGTSVGVEMPITEAVVAVLHEGLPVDQLAPLLLGRPHKAERV